MCTGSVDLGFVLRAYQKGADGVIIGGCWPGECHYVTEGNYDALGNMYLCKRLLEHIGESPDRLRLEWIAASEGTRFAEVMSDFATRLRAMGPIGAANGMDATSFKRKLDAAAQLVPYMKLVEREKLRVPAKTVKAYDEFYQSDEMSRLFETLFAQKLAIGEILLLLGDGALSTRDIATALGLSSSEVARYMSSSSNQGLVRFDQARGCYALA